MKYFGGEVVHEMALKKAGTKVREICQVLYEYVRSGAMILFKHTEDDTFQRICEGKKLGETLTFQRDENGKIVSFKKQGNYLGS